MGRSSPVTPRVRTCGIRTSLLVPLVSTQRVLQVAKMPLVAWTAPFSPQLSLSRALVVFSAPPPLLRRARALVSQHLRPSNTTQRPASFPVSPLLRWLQLPSFSKPALSSPSRAHLAGVRPWSPVSWPGLCSPVFLLILVPKASPCHADARWDSLSPGLSPETSAVGRTPPPCRHSRGQGPQGAVELGFLVPIVAEESEEHDGALGRRRDLAVDEISGSQASPLFSGH